MRVYVAGKTHDYPTVRQIQSVIRDHGHDITYDWTANVEYHGADHEKAPLTPALRQKYAIADMRGVMKAALVVALWNPNWLGSSMEVGAALAHNKPVWVMRKPDRDCIFWDIPGLAMIGEDLTCLNAALAAVSTFETSTEWLQRGILSR